MMKTFTTEIFIGFDETDMGGIAFFGNYYRLAHRVIERFIDECGIGWKTWFGSREWLVPLRHSEADYFAPLFPGENYPARLEVLKIGESSVTFQVEIGPPGHSRAQVRTTHVFVDYTTRKKIPIPSGIRQGLGG